MNCVVVQFTSGAAVRGFSVPDNASFLTGLQGTVECCVTEDPALPITNWSTVSQDGATGANVLMYFNWSGTGQTPVPVQPGRGLFVAASSAGTAYIFFSGPELIQLS